MTPPSSQDRPCGSPTADLPPRTLSVSVVIPTYQRREQVQLAIASVLAQSVPAREIIVVDDGSTDGTATALRERFGSKIDLIVQPNQGVSVARNTGIARATGEWIAFLDSDDVWTKPRLDRVATLISASPAIDFVWGAALDRNATGARVFPAHSGAETATAPILFTLKWMIRTSTVLIRMSTLNALDYYFRPELRTCEDYELFWRAVTVARRVGFVATPDVQRDRRGDGLSRTADPRAQPDLLRRKLLDIATARHEVAMWLQRRDADAELQLSMRFWARWMFRLVLLHDLRHAWIGCLIRDSAWGLRTLGLPRSLHAFVSAIRALISRGQ